MMYKYMNKTNVKRFFSTLLVVFIFISYSSFVYASDDSLYVWSSNANTLNIVGNTTNSTNTTNMTNLSTNSNSSNNMSTNTTNTSINTDTDIGTNTTTNTSTDVSNIEADPSLLTNATSEVIDDNSLNLESESAILIEQSSGRILYAHNIHEQLRPASVTKVMSILLIMETLDSGKISLTDSVPCSENAASMGGSQIWLDTTETLTVDEMLKAICVNSANDCVVAMAEYIAGSEEAFVQMMNDKAFELGMSDTTFKNCHGLDEDGHVTSSYDIAIMSRELLNKYPEIKNYTTIWMDTLRDGETQLSNTNRLIKNYTGATGLKTGSTSLALYNLSASATRDDLSLIAVIMKAPSTKVRFSEAQKLLDYGFNNFSYQSFGKAGDLIQTVSIDKGVQATIPVVLENDAGILLAKGSEKNIEQTVTIDENISAPISAGQKVGEVSFSLDGEVLTTVNLVSQVSVNKMDIATMSTKVFSSWFNLLR